jgi:hypothetical protein
MLSVKVFSVSLTIKEHVNKDSLAEEAVMRKTDVGNQL